MIVIGIDPGKTTGLARWDPQSQRFLSILSMPIHKAMDEVRQEAMPEHVLVLFEDARKRGWFGTMDAKQAKYGAAVREGAGAAKRDSTIWEDFLTDMAIPFISKKPQARSTKWTAEYFKRVTGWPEHTNEHARDAAVLVFGLNMPMVKGLVLDWKGRA
jgi:hypothetical protein